MKDQEFEDYARRAKLKWEAFIYIVVPAVIAAFGALIALSFYAN